MSNLQYDIVTEWMRVKNTGRLLFGGENDVKKVRAMGEAVKGRTVKVDAGADAHAAGALSALLYVAWG